VEKFLAAHDLDLRYDRRVGDAGTPLDCASEILRKGTQLREVYNYLFGLSYLDAQYELRSDGRPITELSPGEKGTILLMFYLLVDRSGRPIALDQPDENLDSHTIHTLLRPAIRAAKANRQILVVTHSPNLAVVGDADQVIVASCDRTRFQYTSGSIENPGIRDLVVRVLEGTWPAFSDRRRKYLTSARSSADDELIA
jgi:ABC-type multidrug transport system ATPase subunit